jgi:hypothetical protein
MNEPSKIHTSRGMYRDEGKDIAGSLFQDRFEPADQIPPLKGVMGGLIGISDL